MEFEGTRGRWKVDVSYNIVDDDGFGIAQIHGIKNESEWVYNSKIIAAAPDLLDALQTYLNAGSKEQRKEASIIAKAAIEKALK